MRSLKLFCIFFIAALSICFTAYAQTTTTGMVNANGGINLRQQATTDSEIVTVIPNRAEIEITEMSVGWSYVKYQEYTGYVYNKFIILKKDGLLYRGRATNKAYIMPDTSLNSFNELATSDPENPEATNNQPETATYVYDGEFIFDESITLEDLTTVADSLLEYAKKFLGTPYVYGGSSSSGFDCSGFTSYVFNEFGYSLSRTASGQQSNGTKVSRSELAPGDLVFFTNSGGGVDHVGIYVGGGQMIHAVKPGVGLRYDTIESGYYHKNYVSAVRVLP